MGESLHIRFQNVIRKIGFEEDIEKPVFYNANIGIRFALGHGEVYVKNTLQKNIPNPIYVSDCTQRAEKLLAAVSPDILRVDVYPNEKYYNVTNDFLIRTLGIPEDCVKADNVHSLYWNIADIDKCIPILREVILSDIGEDYVLNSCVYVANSRNTILYYPYDDRGADIVSDNSEVLMPVYKKFENFVLEKKL